MESPYNRPVAAELIKLTIREWERSRAEGVIGVSLEMMIYTRLKAMGYLTEQAMELDTYG